MTDPVEFIRTAEAGTRMVVRSRIDGGFSDAVGYLRAVTDTECLLDTTRGMKTVTLSAVSAAKAVPPPPPRRAPRFPLEG